MALVVRKNVVRRMVLNAYEVSACDTRETCDLQLINSV